jgi:hypothetical protein
MRTVFTMSNPSRSRGHPVQADRPSPEALPLPTGRITPGVVRVGETVRRPWKSSSPFAALLLAHLETNGFSGAPRYLGRDEHGRDVLSYLPGEVAKFQRFADIQLRATGELLRAFHDATRGSSLAGESSVVCHHDAGPNNFIFQDGRPVALIDFDMAAPGEPLEDLGYVAWVWCVSSKPERQPVSVQAAQVRLLVDAYGLEATQRVDVVDSILERQSRNARFWRDRLTDPGSSLASVERINEYIAWSLRERAYTETHRREFAAALGASGMPEVFTR